MTKNYTKEVIKQLKDAGCIITGKTTPHGVVVKKGEKLYTVPFRIETQKKAKRILKDLKK